MSSLRANDVTLGHKRMIGMILGNQSTSLTGSQSISVQ